MMWAARGPARYTSASATSAATPWCGSGCRLVTVALSKAALMSVAMFAGATALTLMPMGAELDRQTSGGVGDSRLGHPVRQHADAWRDTGARGHVHDRSTAMGSHVTRRGLGGQQHAEQIDRDHPLEVTKVVVEKAAQTARDPSDVADHIKAAEAFHGRSDQSLDLRRVRHIGLHELGALTELLDDLSACLTDVGDNHERSGRDESLRRDASDALSRTRDDRHHAVVLTPHATALPTFDPSIREPNFPDDSAVSHLTNTRE